jgi:hypothetical protein
MRKGGAILVSPKPPAREMIADSCIASAIASAHTVIGAPLALPARTRYNTSSLERPPLWPVLACPPMAGFEVSTEGHYWSHSIPSENSPADTACSACWF